MSTHVLSRARAPRSPARAPRSLGPAPVSRFSATCRSASESLRRRIARLRDLDIDFIPNASFSAKNAEAEIAPEAQLTVADAFRDVGVPGDLPAHLARLCETKLLSAEEETRLFRRMNFVKFKAHILCQQLDAAHPDAGKVARVEQYLKEGEVLRGRIITSNMRLVISVVKKFVTPQSSFDDMLSDGIYSLMHAVEKFDYDRGFRFSTYAYRAIARNAYRMIIDRQREIARFAGNSDETIMDTVDDHASSTVYDEAWDRLRGMLAQMMKRLDRREQFILRGRYALGAHRRVRTFQCLADKLGISKERVRQLEQRAVAKLQNLAAEQPIDEVAGAVFH